jgi:putative peptidoglycan lipid II flippase
MFGTALRLLPLQALFRGGEAVLPLLLAAWLGRNAQTDLFYLLAAYFVFATALLTATFQDSAVVPVLIQVHTNDSASFGTVVGSLLGHTLAIGLALAVGAGAIAAVVVASISSLPALATHLVALMAVGLVATGVRAFYVGVLNARGVFHAHPVASGTGMGLTLAILFASRASLDVRMVPAAILAGELVAIAILAVFCARGLGVRIVPNLARPEPVVRIFKLVRLEAFGQLVTRINPVVDQIMAGMAGVVGGGTLLRYAGDVASLPTSILQATLLPVFLTRVAREADDPATFLATTRRTLATVIALLLVLSGVFAALRVPICRLLFQHGAMDAAGVDAMAAILPWGLLGVAPFGALLILARAHVARQNSRIMPSMGVLNSALNAGLNFAFVRWLGLPGIALSTSITYAIVALVFWIRLPSPDAGARGAT